MRSIILGLLAAVLIYIPTANAQLFHLNTKHATVLIISYDAQGDILGRGTGFYVDDGIVITNIHVIDGYARYYRIFITDVDGEYNPNCYKDITRSDIKLNLEDDVAYIRVYIECPHTSVCFADEDPDIDSPINIYGYPALGDSFYDSFEMIRHDGVVISEWPAKVGLKEYRGPWLLTDALIHGGNSGGPVVQNGKVVGIAVASHEDSTGKATDGVFIPVSIVKSGLENANNSTFGYTPQLEQQNAAYVAPKPEYPYGSASDPFDPKRKMKIATNGVCSGALGEGGEATGVKGCRCKPSYHKNASETACIPGAEGYIDPYNDLMNQPSTVALNNAVDNGATFSDLDSKDFGYKEVMFLKNSEVISGYPDGSYKPHGEVNRAELLKILVSGFHSHELKGETDCFPDVTDEWFAEYACAAKRLGWIEGYPDGTFRPANSVNRAEAIKIIISSGTDGPVPEQYMPTDVEEGSWFYDYVAKGLGAGIITSHGMFFPGNNLTRTDAAVWIYNGINGG